MPVCRLGTKWTAGTLLCYCVLTSPIHLGYGDSGGAEQTVELLQEIQLGNAQIAQLRGHGKDDEALSLAQRLFALAEKNLPVQHPAFVTVLNTLALIYYDRGNYSRAELLFKRGLRIRQQFLAPTHPDLYPGRGLDVSRFR